MKIAETRLETVEEFQKSQAIRLIDIFMIAPILVLAGTKKELSPALRIGLLAIGVATFIYNGRNFLKNYQDDKTESDNSKS